MTAKLYFKSIIFCVFYALCSNIHAQNNAPVKTVGLSEEEIQELNQRYNLKVQEFLSYLSDICSTKLTNLQRQESITAALNLFMGKGSTYFVRNDSGEIEAHNPARIQISSIKSERKRWCPISKFLANLYNNINRYGRIEIYQPKILSIDSLIKLDENLYQGKCLVKLPKLLRRAVDDENLEYQPDSISKYELIFLRSIDTPIGKVWDPRLGDIYVTSNRTDFE